MSVASAGLHARSDIVQPTVCKSYTRYAATARGLGCLNPVCSACADACCCCSLGAHAGTSNVGSSSTDLDMVVQVGATELWAFYSCLHACP